MPDQLSSSWLSNLRSDQDWLYKRLADKVEGWSVNLDDKDVDVPLSELDAAVFKILLSTIETKQKIAITLPRIKSGVTLSLVAYLVVNRLVKSYGRFQSGFKATSLEKDQRIVILTKNRKLRDFFLNSSLNFGHNRTLFSDLAIERLNRLGNLEPIGRKLRTIELFAPVTFYHFDNIEKIPDSMSNSFVIAEFTESDSNDIVDKFTSFIHRIKSCSNLVILNSFDRNKISLLEKEGFSFINFDKDTISSLKLDNEHKQMPSLASSLLPYPSQIKLNIDFIDNQLINEKLQSIFSILLSLSKNSQAHTPRILMSAWNLFYTFKNIAVPLEQLEESRKNNLWLNTLSFNLDKIFNFPLTVLDKPQQEVLLPAWGTLKLEFKELYDQLFQENAKYKRLVQVALDETLTNDAVIVFANKTEANIFKEELSTNHDWIEDESLVQIKDIQQMLLDDEVGKNIILTGAWRPRELSKIIAILPKEITLLCYPSESGSILTSLRYVNSYQPRYGNSQTEKTLSLLNLPLSIQRQDQTDWIILDQKSKNKVEQYQTQQVKEQNQYDEFAYDETSNELESNEYESVENDSENDELVQAYKVILENDSAIYIKSDQEILVYSHEEENIQKVFPDSLQENDMILLYSQEQNQEMFQEILQRTSELSGIKERYINLWKNNIELVKKAIAERYNGSYIKTVKILRELGCKKPDSTIRGWFKGLTMAPQDREDIKAVLEYCVVKNSTYLAEQIDEQMKLLRSFNRELGKRLKRRLTEALRSTEASSPHDKIEQEIDEILESAEVVKVKDVSTAVVSIPKEQVNKYIF